MPRPRKQEKTPTKKSAKTTESASASPTQATVQLLDIPTVAKILCVSRVKVYALIHEHGLPSMKIGRVNRVSLSSLNRWIQEQESTQQAS
jgi:excisionase family DNA binding protein